MTYEEAVKAYAKAMGVSAAEAKKDAEAIVADYIKQGYPREFAEATFIEDTEDTSAEELDKVEKEAKKNGATKVKAQRKSSGIPRKKPERKPNDEKRLLIEELAKCLFECQTPTEDVKIPNIEREITFKVGENDYSLVLTCHRKKK